MPQREPHGRSRSSAINALMDRGRRRLSVAGDFVHYPDGRVVPAEVMRKIERAARPVAASA